MRTLLMLPLVATLAACTGAASSSVCADDSECGGSACVQGSCTEPADAAGDSSAAGDTATSGADSTLPDVADGSADTGGFVLQPCDSGIDCASGFCIPTADGNFCTVPCTLDCPIEGWECQLIQTSESDQAQVCAPPNSYLCEPCDTDADCGGLANLCLSFPDGTFCGTDCSATGECPDGYACTDANRTGSDGTVIAARQCSPTLNTCSGCIDGDSDGFGVGPRCAGADCDDTDGNVYPGHVELCNGSDDNCDGDADEGFVLATDERNCGECGNACTTVRGTGVCTDSVCHVDTCEEGYHDANGDFTDGCEYGCTPNPATGGNEACNEVDDDCDGTIDDGFDLSRDDLNCGRCGIVCESDNASAMCIGGFCELTDCVGSYRDCDGLAENGCESDIQIDPATCGSCTRPCELPHAIPACAAGTCLIAACEDGFADCDLNPLNGCEIDLNSDPYHCGTCERSCTFVGGIAACDAGACRVAACDGATADCNGLYADLCEVDTATSTDHCGGCGRVCGDTNADAVSCGAFGCEIDRCSEGWGNCDGLVGNGCEQDLLDSNDHCGGCNIPCAPTGADGTCMAGLCTWSACLPGFFDIDGDPANGCEYACTPLSATDEPDDTELDANCDGVDGDVARAIFVSTAGSDRNDGTVAVSPVRSLARALEIATTSGRDQVLVAIGTYAGSTLTLNVPAGLYGGYAADFVTRGSTRSQFNATSAVAVDVVGISRAIAIDRMNITSADQSGAGEESVGLRIANAGNYVTVRNSVIWAGVGGNGSNGTNGSSGTGGTNGANGGGTATPPNNTSSAGGAGGVIAGGNGSNGRNQNSGPAGQQGGANGSTCGGAGGASSGGSGLGCNDGNPRDGGTGGDGCEGPSGAQGSSADGTGGWSGLDWTPTMPSAGGNGGSGGGGGGGGAGGGEDCTIFGGCVYCGTGRGGGGGGGGGEGGTGGTAGTSGGASIAVVILNSTVRFDRAQLQTDGGGRGGSGGSGGTGGAGGAGGVGGSSNGDDTVGSGGNGGNGGRGGNGGCGGAGGGGPSAGIWGLGGATITLVDSVFLLGQPGQGGLSCAGNGQDGARADFVGVTVE